MKYLIKLTKNFIYYLPRIFVFSIFIVFLIFAFFSYFGYFEPYLYPLHLMKGKAEKIKENIIIGPFPESSDLKKLKEKFKVTAIISLLDPELPYENSLIEVESKRVKKLGLKFYNFPMTSSNLNSEKNSKSLKKIVELIKTNPNEVYYIHCYKGKHRVTLIKELFK